MKIYVDEMPKSCKSCPFQCYGECKCGVDILTYGYSTLQCHLKKSKPQNCPLQLLTDHDKQVRNELIDEILKHKATIDITIKEDDYVNHKTIDAVFEGVFDQLRGENYE